MLRDTGPWPSQELREVLCGCDVRAQGEPERPARPPACSACLLCAGTWASTWGCREPGRDFQWGCDTARPPVVRRHTPLVLSFQPSGDTGRWTQTLKQHLYEVTSDIEGECSGEKGRRKQGLDWGCGAW